MAENWADLPQELLEPCSRQLLLEDWFAFRSVCSTWRAATFEERVDVPWLMLADDERTETEHAELYSLFSLRTHRVALPEVKGKRRFSSRGWILTIGTDLEVRMLKPLSRSSAAAGRDIVKLPRLDELPGWEPESYIPGRAYADFVDKFVLSASPASSPDYMVMVLYSPYGKLGTWKPGNEEWKKLTRPSSAVLDVIHYKGQFLAVNTPGGIFACDVDGPDPTAQYILKKPPEIREDGFMQLYLVESEGRLLLVSRLGQQGGSDDDDDDEELNGEDCKTNEFQVYAVDLEARKWTKLESLGNASLFVGFKYPPRKKKGRSPLTGERGERKDQLRAPGPECGRVFKPHARFSRFMDRLAKIFHLNLRIYSLLDLEDEPRLRYRKSDRRAIAHRCFAYYESPIARTGHAARA